MHRKIGVVGTKEGVASPISAAPEKKPALSRHIWPCVPVLGVVKENSAALRAVHITFFNQTTPNLLCIRPWLPVKKAIVVLSPPLHIF